MGTDADKQQDENQTEGQTEGQTAEEQNSGGEDTSGAEEMTLESLLAEFDGLTAEQVKGRLAASRTWEKRAKDNFDKAQKYDQAQQEGMTEVQKAEARVTTAESERDEAKTELALYKAATKYSLEEADLEFFRGLPLDDIDEAAGRYARRMKKAAPKSTGDDASGNRGGSVGSDKTTVESQIADLDSKIAQAQKDGRVEQSVALKRQRAALASKKD